MYSRLQVCTLSGAAVRAPTGYTPGEDETMPTYITLTKWTPEGIGNVDESPERLEQAKQVSEKFGGEFKDFYLTFGQYDLVYIAEMPDDEAAAQAVLTVGRGGAVETETFRAFTEDEYREVIDGLSG